MYYIKSLTLEIVTNGSVFGLNYHLSVYKTNIIQCLHKSLLFCWLQRFTLIPYLQNHPLYRNQAAKFPTTLDSFFLLDVDCIR